MHKGCFHTTVSGIAGITAVGIVALFMTPAACCDAVNIDALPRGMVMAIAFIFALSASSPVPVGSSLAIGQTMVPHKALRKNSSRKDEEA